MHTAPDPLTWEVLAVRYGSRSATRHEVFLHYEIYGEPDAPLQMDYFFWILRSAAGIVVVDTGFDRAVGERRGRTTIVEPADALAAAGIDASDIQFIVVTHAHYDHIGNLAAFPEVRVLMSAREYQFWTGATGNRPVFMAAAERQEIEELQRRHDDGTLELVAETHTPLPGLTLTEVGGHTPGQLVVQVATRSQNVVLCADAVHYYEEVDLDRPFATVVDVDKMYQAFSWLRDLASGPDTVLVPGHDPQVMARFPRAPAPLSAYAVTIA